MLPFHRYYEGKEFETNLKEKRPGDLSNELKEALSIPPLAPPPWLIAMQRFGPPPSYPNLKIAGLNSPIPDGAQWGYHPGGWGKPPTDEYGRPLYGDVFGQAPKYDDTQLGEPVSKELWGEMQEDEEEEEEESEEEEEEDEEEADTSGLQTPAGGAETPSGLVSVTSTVPGGLETPDFLELRKRREGTSATEAEDGPPRSLYQVIPERDRNVTGFMGSDRAYDVGGISQRGHNVSMLGQQDRYANKVSLHLLLVCLLVSDVRHTAQGWGRRRRSRPRRARDALRRRAAQAVRRVAKSGLGAWQHAGRPRGLVGRGCGGVGETEKTGRSESFAEGGEVPILSPRLAVDATMPSERCLALSPRIQILPAGRCQCESSRLSARHRELL